MGPNKTVREAAPKAPGKAPTPTARPAPEAPGKAQAGRAPGGATALPSAGAPPPATGAPAGRGKRGRRAAGKGTAAPACMAPTPGGAPATRPAAAGAPVDRGKRGRRAARKGVATKAPKGLPLGRAPAPSPATTGAPAGRGKGGRRTAGQGAALGKSRGPSYVVFARDTALQYEASAKKTGSSAVRLETYRSARSAGEFFDLHPGSAAAARRDLTWDLNKGLCSAPRFIARGDLKAARMNSAGTAHAATSVAYAVMAAASSVDPWAPLPAAVCAVEAAAGNATERALLARFVEYERAEADAHQEPLAGSLASLSSAVPGGNGDGLQLYSDVLVPADECTFDEVRDAALRDELRDHQGLPCAPSSAPEDTSRRVPWPPVGLSG